MIFFTHHFKLAQKNNTQANPNWGRANGKQARFRLLRGLIGSLKNFGQFISANNLYFLFMMYFLLRNDYIVQFKITLFYLQKKRFQMDHTYKFIGLLAV